MAVFQKLHNQEDTLKIVFFIESAPRPIQFIRHNVHVSVFCLFVPLAGIRNQRAWRLLLKERIATIKKLRNNLVYLENILVLNIFLLFKCLSRQTTIP